jgi:hypothetical protein
MDRRGFLKMLGIAAPAAVMAPLLPAVRPRIGGICLKFIPNTARIETLDMSKWRRFPGVTRASWDAISVVPPEGY